jgi:hypothetical protein
LPGRNAIESGWWDGAEARRDNFIARTGQVSLAGIYRERQRATGFLHGYFACKWLPAYAELHCLSSFSFLRGVLASPRNSCSAAQLGYAALAITDECSLAGIVRAHVAAKDAGLKLIVGGEFRLDDGLKWCCWRPTARLTARLPP